MKTQQARKRQEIDKEVVKGRSETEEGRKEEKRPDLLLSFDDPIS